MAAIITNPRKIRKTFCKVVPLFAENEFFSVIKMWPTVNPKNRAVEEVSIRGIALRQKQINAITNIFKDFLTGFTYTAILSQKRRTPQEMRKPKASPTITSVG